MRTKNTIHHSLCMLLALAASVSAQTDDLPYNSGSTGADGALIVPSTLLENWNFAAAYDAAREQIVLFGGRRVQGNVANNTTYLYNGFEWVDAQAATFVSPRDGAAMVYDPVNEVVVMFGGIRPDNTRINETLVWDGTDWTLLAPTTSPVARDQHKMVWDSQRGRVLLFGGSAAGGGQSDLWAWNGTNWSQVATTNTPGALVNNPTHYDIVYDTPNDRIILYSENYRQTWSLDLTNLTWVQISTSSSPDVGSYQRMVYDEARNQVVIAGGSSRAETWIFANNDWQKQAPASGFRWSYGHGLVYNSTDNLVYRFYGYANNTAMQETATWDGTTWTRRLGRDYWIDMADKADGVWNFTQITVPANVDVRFLKNAANAPVTWLAQERVTIAGRVILNGEDAVANDQSGVFANGGPGGFAGGIGGVRLDVSGAYIGTPGQGPGGGAAPSTADTDGERGTYAGTYGNRLVQPLIGGSGGGGASSTDTANGGNGGGGGGAILIASSRDIVIDGAILANGGLARVVGNPSNGEYGGGGSGGAIRLVADRVLGSGSIQANGGDSFGPSGTSDGGAGYIRIEAFYRPIVPNASPVASATAPTATDSFVNDRLLWIANVAGEAVGNNPTGSLLTPDVVFSQEGAIAVIVNSQNIPAGTPVELRVTTSEGLIELPGASDPAVTLNASGAATFNLTVPAGVGSIQALAEFTIGN